MLQGHSVAPSTGRNKKVSGGNSETPGTRSACKSCRTVPYGAVYLEGWQLRFHLAQSTPLSFALSAVPQFEAHNGTPGSFTRNQ